MTLISQKTRVNCFKKIIPVVTYGVIISPLWLFLVILFLSFQGKLSRISSLTYGGNRTPILKIGLQGI